VATADPLSKSLLEKMQISRHLLHRAASGDILLPPRAPPGCFSVQVEGPGTREEGSKIANNAEVGVRKTEDGQLSMYQPDRNLRERQIWTVC